MIRFKTILLLLIVLLSAISESADASHPFHVTRAEIEYNAERQTFEVALCVWPEDLERAVSKMENRDVKIDVESESSRDEIFSRYVAKKFRFVAQAKGDANKEKPAAAKIRWIGSELEIKQGWLYFEVDAKIKGANSAATNWSIENQIFFELNDDQMNHLQIRCGKDWTSQTLSSIKPMANWTRKSE